MLQSCLKKIYEKKLLLFLILLHCNTVPSADLIVFSYDRPLQLYSFLESVELRVTGLDTTTVIYRVSDDAYQAAYEQVKKRFAGVHFYKQMHAVGNDFKNILISSVFNAQARYVLFAVDDIIVTRHVNIVSCIEALEKEKAYAFYLRLGKNITFCYNSSKPCLQPIDLHERLPGIYAWHVKQGDDDWTYPHTLDMALYRKSDIESSLRSLHYINPNTLEARWAGSYAHTHARGLCFEHSMLINIPLNCVQSVFNNKHMNYANSSEMLSLFNNGLKIDVHALSDYAHQSVHVAHFPTLIFR